MKDVRLLQLSVLYRLVLPIRIFREIYNAIFEREALLGVSLTGIMEKHELVLTEKVLKKGAKIAVDTNKELAKKITLIKQQELLA